MRRFVPMLVAASVALVTAAGRADPPSQQALNEARDHAKVGADLFQDKDFRGALAQFRRAYEIAPNFRVQYNIGLTCMELQDWACALAAFEQYLRDGGKDVPAERGNAVEADLERLRRRVAKIRVVVDSPGADVAIDDVVVGRSPLPREAIVNAGQRRVTATLPPNPPVTKTIEVVGGDNVEVSFEIPTAPRAPAIAAPAAPPEPPPPPPPKEAPSPASGPSKVPFVVAASVTGALTAAGIVTGVLALGAKADLRAEVNRWETSPNEVNAARDKASTLATVTDVLFASAIVGGAVTGYFFFTTIVPNASQRSRASVSAGVAPGRVFVSGRF